LTTFLDDIYYIMNKTLKVRVKDKHIPLLRRWAFEVNQVWNAANEISSDLGWMPVPEVGWMSFNTHKFQVIKDLQPMKKERGFDIHSQTSCMVIVEHYVRRRQFKKNKLKWRISSGSKRSLGWVPFNGQAIKYRNGQVRFNGHFFSLWDSYGLGLGQHKIKMGSFNEDSRGRWYLNAVVDVPVEEPRTGNAVGIDLGLKDYATCSDGVKLEASRFYRNAEADIARAQRAKNKKQVKNLHAKVKNRRKDTTHKFTTKVANRYKIIVVGDVSSSKLAKTKMAKSVYDAGWYQLKTLLKYKAMARSGEFIEVNEAYSTRACSACGSLSGPKGLTGLGVREWECPDCGVTHDRDINSAINILTLGLGYQPRQTKSRTDEYTHRGVEMPI
jgi:putative transposase